MRRVYLQGHQNILKRMLQHPAASNLGLLIRRLFGVGTPRSLQSLVVVNTSLRYRLGTASVPVSSGEFDCELIHELQGRSNQIRALEIFCRGLPA
jgi:hypothetical protein